MRTAKVMVLALLAATFCEPANAQEPTADSSRYEQALDDALSAHEAGALPEAQRHMEHAHRLQPSARTLRGLGIIALDQEHFVEAARYLRDSLASPVSPLPADLRTSVLQQMELCWKALARVHVELDPAGAELDVDGQAREFDLAHELWLKPGHHRLTFRAGGHRTRTLELELAGAERRSLHVALSEEAPAAPAAVPAAVLPAIPVASHGAEAADRDWARRTRRLRRARWSLVTLGAASLVASAVTWGTYRSRYNQLDAQCPPEMPCSATERDQKWERLKLDALRTAGIVTTSVGAVLLASGGAIALWESRRDEPAVPAVALSGSGLRLTIRY